MTLTHTVQDKYFDLLKANVLHPEERHLAATEELGRELVLANTPPEDICEIHQEAMAALAEQFPNMTLREIVSPVSACLMEMFIAYGLAFRERLEERGRAEKVLREAAKLQSLGRLAGGVAHDFNNILTGISGFTQLLLAQADEESPMSRDLEQIHDLAARAADLTRQLLAFSRRQPIEPRVFNVNSLVEDTSRMLQRLIGEDVELKFTPGSDLGNTRADPGQIERVLMNLAVNARDAMPAGGKLTIETANVTLDRHYTDGHPGVRPGQYVLLAVTDTGCGMTDAIRRHIFEPFFTTKQMGKGTGLGLATVYGIVKQHGGHISVYSERGKGTTFKIYLPMVEAEAERLRRTAQREQPPGGTETILVVEDEGAVRELTTRVLQERGYTVFAAASPAEAERICTENGHGTALLLTDVVLPECNGRQLYERIVRKYPGLKVLYTSGYTDDAIVQYGVLKRGTPFLAKPYEPHALARKVREVLDVRSVAAGQGVVAAGGP